MQKTAIAIGGGLVAVVLLLSSGLVSAHGFFGSKDIDPATLPDDALVLSDWSHAVPLWYAQFARMDRPDIEVRAGERGQWKPWCRDAGDRPVYLVHKMSWVDDQRLEPYHNVWRVSPVGDADE